MFSLIIPSLLNIMRLNYNQTRAQVNYRLIRIIKARNLQSSFSYCPHGHLIITKSWFLPLRFVQHISALYIYATRLQIPRVLTQGHLA